VDEDIQEEDLTLRIESPPAEESSFRISLPEAPKEIEPEETRAAVEEQ
jgi:hypothetical protein